MDFYKNIKYLQRDYYENIIEIINSNTNFIDEDFNSIESIDINDKLENEIINNIIFKKMIEIYPNTDSKIFKNQTYIKISSLLEGKLFSNLCFLKCIAILLLYDQNLITRLFLTTEINKYGIYCFLLFYDGEWNNIIIDDKFAFSKNNNEFLFSKCSENELWLSLLEKAYAKNYGSYFNLKNGNIFDCLFDFIGVTPFVLKIQNFDNRNQLFDIIESNINKSK